MSLIRHRAGLGLLGATSFALLIAAAPPAIPPWGFDLGGMDPSVRPGDDFDRYSNGGFKQATPIPPDRSAWGPFAMLRAKAESDVKAIVDDLAGRPQKAGSVERKIADTYNAYLDTKAIEAAGWAPVAADLAKIAAARSHQEIAGLMGHPELGASGPLSITPWPDAANPDRYAINIVQSGLSLPDRDFYLKDDARSREVRTKLRSYVAAMLALGRHPDPERAADAVVALETGIAQAHWTRGALVENLRSAFRVRIERLDWMSAETRQAALAKLAAIRVKVGHPDRWRDYATLEVRPGDPVGNRKRALAWDWQRRIARLGQLTDREEWGMTPQNVNAYSNSFFNEIVFPAAMLQPPYFDPAADPAVNYGGIGGVIGHEMSHAFDDQGAKTDARGAERNWWSSADRERFRALTGRLAEQYSRYEPIPGAFVNGAMTLSENIGDLGGLSIALEAYRISLHGEPAPILDGTSGDQRFFLSWAQTYRENIRDQALRANLASDPHSPSVFRVNGVVRNIGAWYEAFGIEPGDRLYLKPGDRIGIW